MLPVRHIKTKPVDIDGAGIKWFNCFYFMVVSMNFCSACGEKVSFLVPEGDNRQRYVCQSCQTIHYQNPMIVTGCIAQWQDKILLCRRAIEPRYGLWTLPAGFMENQEISSFSSINLSAIVFI